MAKTGSKIAYQRKILLKYRVHLDSLSGDGIDRIERAIDVFERVERTIELSEQQHADLEKTIGGLKADLAVEQGKAFLIHGEYAEAARSFSNANAHRRSLKLTAVGLLTRLAPQTLLRFYKTSRPADIAFTPRQN
jgi:hypothetical protein